MIKFILLYLSLSFWVVSCSQTNSSSGISGGGGTTLDPTTTIELTVGAISNTKSTFNFYYHTRDSISKTDNRWDILALDDTTDKFVVQLSAFDRSSIADLGAKNCSAVALSDSQKTDYASDLEAGGVAESHRLSAPDYWIAFTDAMRTLQTSPQTSVDITAGHCYIFANANEKYTVTALFNVDTVAADGSDLVVTLKEIETFNKKSVEQVGSLGDSVEDPSGKKLTP